MSFGFLLFPDTAAVYSHKIRVSLTHGPLPNRRTKFDRTKLFVYRGDDEDFMFEAWQGNRTVNLYNFVIKATGRKTAQHQETLFNFTIVDGVNGSDFAKGIFVLSIPANITKDLPSLLKYDIQAEGNGKIITLVSGQIEVRNEYVNDYNDNNP